MFVYIQRNYERGVDACTDYDHSHTPNVGLLVPVIITLETLTTPPTFLVSLDLHHPLNEERNDRSLQAPLTPNHPLQKK